MEWKEIILATTYQAYPALANLLTESGVAGISKQETDSSGAELIVKAYLQADRKEIKYLKDQLKARLSSLQESGLETGRDKITIQSVKQQDWSSQWKENFAPLQLTEQITVKPSWEDYASRDEIIIEIDPGQAFGTGYHATTKDSLRLLESYLQPGTNLLDIGTGTGILAIAAAKLGIDSGLGIDIDQQAVETATENAVLNQVESQLEFKVGDLLTGIRDRYHLVTANILPHILLDLIPELEEVLAEDGVFILSGIIDSKSAKIRNSLQDSGLQIEATIQTEDWISLAGSRSR